MVKSIFSRVSVRAASRWNHRARRVLAMTPVFIPAGHSESFGELGDSVKSRLSHRAAAVQKLREGLEAFEV